MKRIMQIAASAMFAATVCSADWTDSLDVTSSDMTNAFAVLAWSPPPGGSSTLVHRATSPGGPYAEVAALDDAQNTWMDEDVTQSVRYYYRLSELRDDGGSFVEEAPGPFVSYIPLMPIERSWINRGTIRPGMSLLGTHFPYWSGSLYSVAALFDGNTNTFHDAYAGDIAIGVNFGKPYCVSFIRVFARDTPASLERLNGTELRGSNDTLFYTNSFTRLMTISGAVGGQFATLQTEVREPFQCLFVQRPDGEYSHGTINELEFYGWDPDILESVFKAPHSVSIADMPDFGVVQLDWEPGTQQDSYRVERSVDGENWIPIGTTMRGAFSDMAPLVGQEAFYRVVAVQDSEEAFSDVYSIIASPKNGNPNPELFPPGGLKFSCPNVTNAFPMLAWSNPPYLTTLVYRATSPGGPYDLMASVDGSLGMWTDTGVVPNIRYYYRLGALWNDGVNPPVESAQSPYSAYIPCVPIERGWEDRTKVKPGMTIITGSNVSTENPYDAGSIPNMFDDRWDTYSNMGLQDAYIGLNLQKQYCVSFIRIAPRPDYASYVNGRVVCGSNDAENWNTVNTNLLTIQGAKEGELVTVQSMNQEPFQFVFVKSLYGSITEWEIFGWDPDVLNSIFKAPDPVDIETEPGRAVLTWELGTQQDSYRIERSTDGGATWVGAGVTTANRFKDGGSPIRQNVLYRVVAVKGGEPDQYSDAFPAFVEPGFGSIIIVK